MIDKTVPDVAAAVADNAGRVRQALAMAIDRRLLVERVLQGAALATTQFMPPGSYSALPDRPVPAADAEGARRLLAEARAAASL